MSGKKSQGSNNEKIFFRYLIRRAGGEEKDFTVRLDYDTLDIMSEPVEDPPDWTRLDFYGCPNCPLDKAEDRHCPVAVTMIELIDFLKDLSSWEEVDVKVETAERTYASQTSLQNVAGSLMGIYMVTSGCPVLNKMRPMVETHLPFSSWRETVYRVVSMYLFAQYFLLKNDQEPHWDLKGLVDYYKEVQKVNVAFSERLLNVPAREGDASLNAVSLLSSLASMATISIQSHDLAHWQDLFMAHWGDA